MTDGADQEGATDQGAQCDRDRRQSRLAIEFPDRRTGIDRRKSARGIAAQQEHDAAVVMARKTLLTFGMSSPEFAAAQSVTSEARSRMAAAEREDDDADQLTTSASAWMASPTCSPSNVERNVERKEQNRGITLTSSEGLYHRLTAYAEKHGMTRPVALRRLLRQALDRG